MPRDFWGSENNRNREFGCYKRYREFGGKEQREEPRVREFREFGTASLRGITVLLWPLRLPILDHICPYILYLQ